MDFIKIERASAGNDGKTESCLIYKERDFTNGDIARLKKVCDCCDHNVERWADFDEYVETVVKAFNDAYKENIGVVFGSHSIEGECGW